jgi:hypothetical protein
VVFLPSPFALYSAARALRNPTAAAPAVFAGPIELPAYYRHTDIDMDMHKSTMTYGMDGGMLPEDEKSNLGFSGGGGVYAWLDRSTTDTRTLSILAPHSARHSASNSGGTSLYSATDNNKGDDNLVVVTAYYRDRAFHSFIHDYHSRTYLN